eukprot:6755896-Prymnesium_polylepis.1
MCIRDSLMTQVSLAAWTGAARVRAECSRVARAGRAGRSGHGHAGRCDACLRQRGLFAGRCCGLRGAKAAAQRACRQAQPRSAEPQGWRRLGAVERGRPIPSHKERQHAARAVGLGQRVVWASLGPPPAA